MIDGLLKFYFKENTFDYLQFKSTYRLSAQALIITLSSFIVAVITYFIFINTINFNPSAGIIFAILIFIILVFVSIYILTKQINKMKADFLKKNKNFLGNYCSTFQEYRIYNFLHKIGQDSYFLNDEDFFKNLHQKCTYIISSFNHISAIRPKDMIFYTGIISLVTSCFSGVFSELFKERKISIIPLILISVGIIVIWFSLSNLIKSLELDLGSKIYKYKNLQVHLKSAEMLHKKLCNIHGDDYLSKSINSKKNNDIKFITSFFESTDFTSADIECISTFINNFTLTKKNK